MSKSLNGTSQNELLALSENISQKTKQISDLFGATHHPALTFAAGSAEPPSTPEYLELHESLKTSLEDLQRLVDGPRRHMRAFLLEGYDLAAFQVALDFGFFDIVPAQGSISLEDLSKKAGLDVDRVSRMVRMMINHRFFEENSPGQISHNNASLVLQQDEEFRCTVHYTLDEMWKAATSTSDYLREQPLEVNSAVTAFSIRHGLPIFQYYAQDPKRAGRFARAMAGATRMDRHLNELRDCFPWGSLKGRLIDVGGGSGHISIALARLFPNLTSVVQDGSNDMLAQGQALLDDEVKGRVTFMKHSFFDPEPLGDAGCFLIRQCTHNWCDKDVVTMFKGIVPGLEKSAPGTPFLINDIIMPEPGTIPRHLERELRQIDMIMLVAFGAKQRTRAEFEALLKEADPRYVIKSVQGEGKPLGLLEVYLEQ